MIKKNKMVNGRKRLYETLNEIELDPLLDQCFNPFGRVGKTKRKKTGLRRVL